MDNCTIFIKSNLYLKITQLEPLLLINYTRILEYWLTESKEVFSRKNKLSGYGISPSHLDKKSPAQKIYSEIYGKRFPKKGMKKAEWKEILEHLKMKQKNGMISNEIPLDKTTPESLGKWFLKSKRKFYKRPQINSRFFREHKDALLKHRFITILEHPSKKTKYFSLAPLGIIFLIRNRGYGFQGELIEKTLRILNVFYLQTSPKILGIKNKFNFNNLINKTTKSDYIVTNTVNQFLHNQIEYSKSSFEDESYYISVRYPITFNLENIVARFILSNDEIKFYDNLIVKYGLLVTDYLEPKEFHTFLATYSLYGICYYIIKEHFDDFISSRKFTKIDDFKYSDYDYVFKRIEKYDKELLKLVNLLNEYFTQMLSDNGEIRKQLNFFTDRIQKIEKGEKIRGKKYKNDPNSWLFAEFKNK